MKAPFLQSPRLDLFLFQMDDLADIHPCVTTTLTRYMTWEPAHSFKELEQIGQNGSLLKQSIPTVILFYVIKKPIFLLA